MAELIRLGAYRRGSDPQVGEAVWLALIGAHTCYYADERLIEEARLEIEAIKEALEASREKPALVNMTESSHGASLARTN